MPDWKYVLVVVLKGNTAEGQPPSQDAEIIQVDMVAVDKTEKRIDHEQFHAYVRPQLNPQLDDTCKEANRVYQYSIDEAEPWLQVKQRIEEWLKRKGLDANQENFVTVSDGATGYDKLLKAQCRVSNTAIPAWSSNWIDIRNEVKTAHNVPDHRDRLDRHRMGQLAGVSLEGSRKGSGRDEAFDTAAIVLSLLRNGHSFEHAETLSLS